MIDNATESGIIGLWNEYLDDLKDEDIASGTLEAMEQFCTLAGVKKESPLAMQFIGFRAGVIKGFEVAAGESKEYSRMLN